MQLYKSVVTIKCPFVFFNQNPIIYIYIYIYIYKHTHTHARAPRVRVRRGVAAALKVFHFLSAFSAILQIFLNYLVIIATGGMRALLTATISFTVLTTRLLVNKCL